MTDKTDNPLEKEKKAKTPVSERKPKKPSSKGRKKRKKPTEKTTAKKKVATKKNDGVPAPSSAGAPAIPIAAAGESVPPTEREVREKVEASFNSSTYISPPEGLSEVATKKWNEIMLSYEKQGINVVNILDTTQLVLYVQSFERYYEAHTTWSTTLKKLLGVTDKATDQIIKRCLNVMNNETAIMTRIAPGLCLTPTGRAKFGIGVAKAQAESDKDSLAALNNFFGNLGDS